MMTAPTRAAENFMPNTLWLKLYAQAIEQSREWRKQCDVRINQLLEQPTTAQVDWKRIPSIAQLRRQWSAYETTQPNLAALVAAMREE